MRLISARSVVRVHLSPPFPAEAGEQRKLPFRRQADAEHQFERTVFFGAQAQKPNGRVHRFERSAQPMQAELASQTCRF